MLDSLNILLLLGLFFASLESTFALTCERLLQQSPRQVPTSNFRFASGAAEKLNSFKLDEDRFFAILGGKPYIPIGVNATEFWMIVFESNPRLGDRGIKISGHQEGSTYVIDKVGRSHYADEREYFQRVAELTGVGPRTFALRYGIFDCHSLVVRAATQVKLWLKHRVRPEEVIEFVDQPQIRPLPDGHDNPLHERYHFTARTKNGLPFRAIVEVEPDCHHHLVTAFQER